MLLLCHPTGNANVRGVLDALDESNLLAEFVTAVAAFEGNLFDRLAKSRFGSEFGRRRFRPELEPLTGQRPMPELARLLATRLGLRMLVRHEVGLFCIDKVFRRLDRHAARRLGCIAVSRPGGGAGRQSRITGVYAYEDAALATFRTAEAQGLARIYDLPIGYWRAARRILGGEAERRPEWAPSMSGLRDSQAKLARKDEELKLADHILVASTFTKKTLEECPFPLAPVSVIPYGANEEAGAVKDARGSSTSEPLKVLFVGGLSQRKGIADLFEAVEMLRTHVQLTVIGRKPGDACRPLENALKKHRWIESLPREKILEEMQAHDVFVFPSLFEGFGLVVTEALSQGLPVITTPHTCGPDVLTEGEDGFIVPIRDPQAIAEKLELLHRDRDRLAAMSEAARKKAQTLTWESYRRGIVSVVREVLEQKA